LGETFEPFLTAGVIKKVLFDQEALKAMFVGKSVPKDGVGPALMEHVTKVLQAKKDKKNKKPKEASPPRSTEKRNQKDLKSPSPKKSRKS
jgi:hypothetical protein